MVDFCFVFVLGNLLPFDPLRIRCYLSYIILIYYFRSDDQRLCVLGM